MSRSPTAPRTYVPRKAVPIKRRNSGGRLSLEHPLTPRGSWWRGPRLFSPTLWSSAKYGLFSAAFIFLVGCQHFAGMHESHFQHSGPGRANLSSLFPDFILRHSRHSRDSSSSSSSSSHDAHFTSLLQQQEALGAAEGEGIPKGGGSSHAAQSIHASSDTASTKSLAAEEHGEGVGNSARLLEESTDSHLQHEAGAKGKRSKGIDREYMRKQREQQRKEKLLRRERRRQREQRGQESCNECLQEVARLSELKSRARKAARRKRRPRGAGRALLTVKDRRKKRRRRRSSLQDGSGGEDVGGGKVRVGGSIGVGGETGGSVGDGMQLSAVGHKGGTDSLVQELLRLDEEIQRMKQEKMDLLVATEKLQRELASVEDMLQGRGEWEQQRITKRAQEGAVLMLSQTCDAMERERKRLRLSNKWHRRIPQAETWKGYSCTATQEEIDRYMAYEARGLCPDDWFFVQELVFFKDCFALPIRRCFARTPQAPSEPVPLPQALFAQEALKDENVRWDQHQCKSFECLNTRSLGDCRNCFNMSLESERWMFSYRGNLKMLEVIEMKKGSLRLGLDAGGGTGSFAAHMARYGVTVMTTAMNYETVKFRHAGIPYFETIALRGVIPLFVPHKAKLPLFDNTLDVIHNVNTVKYMAIQEFQELVYEWDRVLRPGGIMWFEMFYAPVEEMPIYVVVLDQLQYKRLYWNVYPKPDKGERHHGAHVYLNCIIEKPARADTTKHASDEAGGLPPVDSNGSHPAYPKGPGTGDWTGDFPASEAPEDVPPARGDDSLLVLPSKHAKAKAGQKKKRMRTIA